MYAGQLVFAQLMNFLPRHEFNACVRRYDGDRRLRGFSCRDQFLCLAFAQLTFRESLRDIETCLRAVRSKLYHAGFRGAISRSTLADANRVYDWRIYADFAQVLIGHARKLYADEPLSTMLAETVYALDSTTIDLCLKLFPWARFRRRKGAVKLHTLLGPARQHPLFYPHFARENARRHRTRSIADRGRRVLCYGSRLRRFSTPAPLNDGRGVLRHPRQTEPRLHSSLGSPPRQDHGPAQRSDHRLGGAEVVATISRPPCVALRSTTRNTIAAWCS